MPPGNLCHLEAKRKKLGAKIDIINTLSMSMVKIFSQLLLYLVWMIGVRYLSPLAYAMQYD